MALFIGTYHEGYDRIFDDYGKACASNPKSLYIAPDKEKNWRTGSPKFETECFVLHFGEPVRARYIPCGTAGVYEFLGYGCLKSVHKTDGWLPMNWYMDVPPDDEIMAHWQEEVPGGEIEYDNPGPVDAAGNYVM